jgi:cytoskeletal protein CcmA (bactofilin family)
MSSRECDEGGRRAAAASARLAGAVDGIFALRLDVSPADAREVADARTGMCPLPTRRADRLLEPLAAAEALPAPVGHLVALDDALVIPAGSLVRGRVRARALLLSGEIVGTVHCGAGPVVIRPGASLKGQLFAGGDVHVCGAVVDYASGPVITTPGRLVLAPGARIEGDVRSGWLEIHEGAELNGSARRFER